MAKRKKLKKRAKNQAAARLGRLGGLARAKSLTQEERSASARKAGLARHGLVVDASTKKKLT